METLIVLALLGAAAAWGVLAYNRLVNLRQACANGWAQIDVHLKRRQDIVPQLVSAVQGAMAHERETLDAVISARAKAVAAGHAPTPDAVKAEGEFGAALSRLMMLTEAYPQLQAQATIRDLMEEIRATENKIAFARQGYNDSVEAFNARIQNVPDVFVNRLFLKAEPLVFWQVDKAKRTEMEEAPPSFDLTRR
jgi:LemA protein